MHRIFKKFTKFSNWINVGKSTVEKYVQKLNLESSGYFGFEEHPAKTNMLEFRIADNMIKDVKYNGIIIMNSTQSIVCTKCNKFYQIHDISRDNLVGKEIVYNNFDQILLGYKVVKIESIHSAIAFEDIKMVGHIYIFREVEYVFFDYFV